MVTMFFRAAIVEAAGLTGAWMAASATAIDTMTATATTVIVTTTAMVTAAVSGDAIAAEMIVIVAIDAALTVVPIGIATDATGINARKSTDRG